MAPAPGQMAKPVVPAPSANEPTKATTVWVNTDTLLAKSTYYKAIQSKLEKQEAALKRDLQSREATLMREVQEYQGKGAGMTDDQRKLTEANLKRREQEYYQYRDQSAARLDDTRGKQVEELQKQLEDYLKAFNKERSYHYILSYTKGGNVLLADPALEITDVVLKGLNDTYAAGKAK